MDQAAAAVLGEKFFVEVKGKTNGAHQEIVSKLESTRHTEVSSLGESDYHLIFYSTMSEVCISKSLENISGKPIILVVMHHAFNPDKVVAPSRRQVDNLNVCLTVDCLFYEDKLLQCEHNDSAWVEIQKSLKVSTSEVSTPNDFINLLWKKFFIKVMGNANEGHQEIVSKLKSTGQTEVSSIEESDYILVFCPIISQVGIDNGEALENISDGKPIILVVMHHTFNPDQVVGPSREQVENPDVHLTVDCLFYEDKLLQCDCNDTAWVKIQNTLRVSPSQRPFLDDCVNLLWKKFFVKVMGNNNEENNEGHQEIVSKLKSTGHTEVSSLQESDYHLIFCSTMSEDDISKYLKNISELTGRNLIILVVMHNASNPADVEAPCRTQMNNLDAYLTVDCLFYEGKLLQCEHNDIAWAKIQKSLGVSTPQVPGSNDSSNSLRENFFVIVSGKTNGAHQDIVSKLKSSGQTEVSSAEESDYRLVFCPIASRVGTDISEALENISSGKPIILVVMHHTFNPDQVVAPSRRQVDNPNVYLTVDCLFYEGKPLQCERNDIAWVDIQKCLGISAPQGCITRLLNFGYSYVCSGNEKEEL